MIDFSICQASLERNIKKARENGIILPTISQLKNPETVPEEIKERLRHVGMQDFSPLNLFRITWKNEPVHFGGTYGKPNIIELPHELTGVRARIFCLVGKWFPTGCHKVGAAYGCMVPKLVTGQFDAANQKSVWPSTGNFCRGGAFNAKILSCESIAVMPENMSQERFEWLSGIVSETLRISGGDSNVKAVFDCVNELKRTRSDAMIFNQFDEMGNHLWHYHVTGTAASEAFEMLRTEGDRFAGVCFATGSAGTIGCADYLKEKYPCIKVSAVESLQCPTMLNNGFGEHRIEGIGDRHVPWIHNIRNTDNVICIDDNDPMRILRLFNEKAGRQYLKEEAKVDPEFVDNLDIFGISGIANVLACIKMAKYYELTEKDILGTVLTDTSALYQSRIRELAAAQGEYSVSKAAVDHAYAMLGARTDYVHELTYPERKQIHNLKYYTWVEQQGHAASELNALWYQPENTWDSVHRDITQLDELIENFNRAVAGA